MKLFLALTLLSFSLFAKVFTYNLYDKSEKTPFTVDIAIVEDFKAPNEVMRISVNMKTSSTYPIEIFRFEERSLRNNFRFKWINNDTLQIKSKNRSFKANVYSTYMNPWGEASINSTDNYTLDLGYGIKLNKLEQINNNEFAIINKDQDAAVLWGTLIK